MNRNDPHGDAPLGVITLTPTALLCTHCTDLYSLMAEGPYVYHRQCTHPRKSRSAWYTRCTTLNNIHGNVTLDGEHSAINRVLLHPLYGPVELSDGGLVTSPTGCVHILGSTVVPYTLSVCFGMTLMTMHCWTVNTSTNGVVIHPLYGLVQLNGGGPCRSPKGSGQVLVSLVASFILGVQVGTTLSVI